MPDRQCLSGTGKKTGAGNANRENVIDIGKYRWWRTGQHLRSKLAEFADHEMLMDEVGKARERYFSVIEPDLADYEDEFLMERFFEWFIFDYLIRGRTLLEYVLMAGNFTREEAELLEKWGKSRCSIYQVVKVSDAHAVTLKDLIRGGKVFVSEPDTVQEIVQGQLLFIRILPVGDEFEFSTGGLILPAYSKDYILSRVNFDAELFWGKNGRRSKWDAYLQRRSHIINALVMETSSIVWDLEQKYDKELGEELNKAGGSSTQLAQRATNVFLDYFYDRWINEPMDILQGQTPLEASRTKTGRSKLQTLLLELLKVEKKRAKKGEPTYDFAKVCRKLNIPLVSCMEELKHNDENGHDYSEVSKLIKDGLIEMGYPAQQIKIAEKMWWDYSKIVSPTFKKPETWAAAVIYAVSRSTGNKLINQNTLADKYSVSASTISNNYRNMCRILQINKNLEQ